ncbi:MAG: glycosyltransferase family 25 protein, partial [Rectinemataceae bacterium]
PFAALNAYFDAVWVLTIPRSAGRREFMSRQLEGLEFEFFTGVDGSILGSDPRVDLPAALARYGRPVRINELACTLSHLVMFQSMLDSGLERLLVFEDDAVFLRRNAAWVSYCLERLPVDWELFYLGYRDGELRGFQREFQELLGRKRDPSEVVSRSVGRGIRTAAGHDYTHAYAVTSEGARKLLEGAYPVQYTADGWLEHKVIERKITAYISVPKLFAQQESLGSSIHQS